ncbi:MAG: DUF1963 domain-containing protein [Agriterribacter sp.]
MLPDFLKEYKQAIDKYKLETIRIEAVPLKEGKNLPFKKSKFLGKPYLPVTHKYPVSKFGKPMILFAQINFEEMPRLKGYPSKGIFQIFTSECFWAEGTEYFSFLYHKDTTQKHQTDFSFLTEDLYLDLPINCEHKLNFSKEIDCGGRTDFRFDLKFNGKSFKEFKKELTHEESKELNKLFNSSGHKIGGYAYFTQEDPRQHKSENKNDVLLLQIDTDKEIMFGDAGISNVFINKDDLKKKKFDKAYFNWDCC